MRLLGLLGGMSWQSTTEYYRRINEHIATRVGGLHSARLIVYSVDMAPIAELQLRGEWDTAGAMLAEAAQAIERAGAEALVIATNTMHQVAPAIRQAIGIPLLHIVDPVGAALLDAGTQRAALLGTRYTMELPFWRERLSERFGVTVLTPDAADRDEVNRVIYEELCLGIIRESSRQRYVRVIESLRARGAECVILGCTEISLLISASDSPLPAFDTTTLHARAAADFMLD